MKKLTAFVSMLLVSSGMFFCAAQEFESVQESVIPKEIYAGDRAQLNYTFRTAVDFFAEADTARINGDTLTLVVKDETFAFLQDKCSITSAVLVRDNMNYTLKINFIPWEPGQLDFSDIDLISLVKGSTHSEGAFTIRPSSIVVSSLSEKLGVSALRPPASPIQLPGTNYILWTIIIIFVLLLLAVGLLILKLPSIKEHHRRNRERSLYRKNEKNALRKLDRLIHSGVNDKDFAVQWQHILRSYLSGRFRVPFENTSASEIADHIREITQETLSGDEQILVELLGSMFVRTDYIRYAQGSVDASLMPVEEHAASFLPMEKESILQNSIDLIEAIENYGKTEEKND